MYLNKPFIVAFAALLLLFPPFFTFAAYSNVTLIPLTIFNDANKTWFKAIDFCYDNFQVRLASNDYSLKNLINIIEDDINSVQVWTGIFRRGMIDSRWRNQDGEIVDLDELQMALCEEPNRGENCLSWKKQMPNERSCFQPKDCSERLNYYACEVLRIDFDSKMLSRYEKLFTGWNISTGVLSKESSLNFGPLVDHTLFEGKYDVKGANLVDFAGKGEANASSEYDDRFSAVRAYLPGIETYWGTEPKSGYMNESIWFKFNTPLIVNTIYLQYPSYIYRVYSKRHNYYPIYGTDKMSFFGSDSPNCDEDRQILSTQVMLGTTTFIDNRRKFLCYGIHVNASREVTYVALTRPIQYHEINECQQNCDGKFASIFEKMEEMNFNTDGESNVHWEMYSYMSKSNSDNIKKNDSISVGSNIYDHPNEEWSLQTGSDTTLNMKYISNSKLIAIDDMIFKQNPSNRTCDPGKFGTKCQRTCHCQYGESCHLFSGHCNCKDGFYGLDCQGEISCLPLGGSSNGAFHCRKTENHTFGTTCDLTCDDGYQLLNGISTSITCKQKVPNQEESHWEGWQENLDLYSNFCEEINECAEENKCNGQNCINALGDFECDCGFDLVGKQCEMNLTGGIKKPDDSSISCISGKNCEITVPKTIPSFAEFYTLKAFPTSVNRRSDSTKEIDMFKDCEPQASYLPLFYYVRGDMEYSTIILLDGKVLNGPCKNKISLVKGQQYEVRLTIVTNVTNFVDRRDFFWQYLIINNSPTAFAAYSNITLIPLTIFDNADKSWFEAIDFCYKNFQVRLASNNYSLKNLINVIEGDINFAQVWTGIFRRGMIDSRWWNQDGEIVDLDALRMTLCEEPNLGENCLSWKKRTPNERSCFQPKDCSEYLNYYACEVLKIDFDSKMLSRYEELFTGWNISTGVLSEESSLNFGPLVDHTLYEGNYDVKGANLVDFAGKGEASASSEYIDSNDRCTAESAYLPSEKTYWATKKKEGYLKESIWFRFHTALIINKVYLQYPSLIYGTNAKKNNYYPIYGTDKMSFFGSDSPNCNEDQHILSTEVMLGTTTFIDNHRKFLCYGIHVNTIREVRYVALTRPIQYYKINECQQNCDGKFASIFEKTEEMNFNTDGESNIHWEIYSYMSKSNSDNLEKKDSISVGSNIYDHPNEEWSLRTGSDTTLNMKYISNSRLIAIDDMIFKQDPSNRTCDPGKFGTKCQRKCHCQDGGSCHLFSGHCDCKDGFYGLDCQGKISCLPLGGSSNGAFHCRKTENHTFGTTCDLTCDDGYQLLNGISTSITCKQKVSNQEESHWEGWLENLDQYSNFCEDINECAEENKCNGKNCINALGDFECDCGFDLVGKQCEMNLTGGIEKPKISTIFCISGEKCQMNVPIRIPLYAKFYTLKAFPTSVNRRSDSTEEIVMFKDCEPRAGYLPLFYYVRGDMEYSTIILQDGKVLNGPCKNKISLVKGQQYEVRLTIVTNVTNFVDRRDFFWQYLIINNSPTTLLTTMTSTSWIIIVGVSVGINCILLVVVVVLIVQRSGNQPPKDPTSQYDDASGVVSEGEADHATGVVGEGEGVVPCDSLNKSISAAAIATETAHTTSIDFDKMEDNVTDFDNVTEILYNDASSVVPHESLKESTATNVSAAATATETAYATDNYYSSIDFDEMEDNVTDIDNVMGKVYVNTSEYETSGTYTQRLPTRRAVTSSAIAITTPEPIEETSGTYTQRLPTHGAH